MLRATLTVAALLSLCGASILAIDNQEKGKKDAPTDKQAKANQQAKATITNVDAKAGTVTVKMKDKEGKDHERTFKLTEDVRYFDSTGKVAAIDVFRSGHWVLIVEQEGKLKEMRQEKDQGKTDTTEKKKMDSKK